MDSFFIIMVYRTYGQFETDIENAITQILTKYGYKLVSIETGQLDKNPLLSIYIFNSDRNDLDGVVCVNKELSAIFDNLNISEKFTVEISTPGISRKLKSADEFNIFIGLELKVVCISNKEIVVGENLGIKDGFLNIKVKDDSIKIVELKNISKAQLNG